MMLNLHKLFPDHFVKDEWINIDLGNMYKEFSHHSHEYALKCIFVEGLKYSRHLKKSVIQNQTENDPEIEKKITAQAMSMGKIFERCV